MKRVKLIALDMDGTLLASDHWTVPQGNIDAIRRVHAAGVRVCICTGRMLEDASDFCRRLNLPCMVVSGNGTRASDAPLPQGRVLLKKDLKPQDAHRVIDLVHGSGLAIHGFEDGAVNSIQGKNGQEYHLVSRGLIRANYGEAALRAAADRGLLKLFIVGDGFAGDSYSAQIASLREKLTAALPHLQITSSAPGNLEIVSCDAGKGRALAEIAEQMGLEREAVMAVGDAGNDLSMLEYAYHSVAMANATVEVLAACRYHTASNDDCGVAKIIERVLAARED